jgi:hypothetical protein
MSQDVEIIPPAHELADTEYAPLLEVKGEDYTLLMEEPLKGVLCKLSYKEQGKYLRYLDTLRKSGTKAAALTKVGKEVERINKLQRKRAEALKAKGSGLTNDFERNKDGVIINSAGNMRLGLEKLGVTLRFDVFGQQPMVTGPGDLAERRVDDEAINRLWVSLDDNFGYIPPLSHFTTVLFDTASLNKYHPVHDYIGSLKWDGEPRLETWLIRASGIEDNAFHRAMSRLWLMAAVARVYKPGCKFDEMLLLCGEQGLSKSTLFKALLPDEDWFTDALPLGEKDQKIIEVTRGKWIVEIADLKGDSKVEANNVKAFMSAQQEIARLAYARTTSQVPRQFVIGGTTNLEHPLSDPTGNRRYWPAVCRYIDLDYIKDNRDQIWAEAYDAYLFDGDIRLDPALYAEASLVQAKFQKENVFATALQSHLGQFKDGMIASTSVWDILRIPVERRNVNLMLFGAALKALGWERDDQRINGVVSSVYRVGESKRLIVVVRDALGEGARMCYADEIPSDFDDDPA